MPLRTTDFYTSHEALLLGYEQAMTRIDSTSGDWYDTSGHLIWIGDRTRHPDDAHVEFCAASRIPSGSNAGRASMPDDLLKLIDILNPGEQAGPADADLPLRLRQDRRQSAAADPRGQARRQAVVWSSDPMHGNTINAATGYKTRPFDAS